MTLQTTGAWTLSHDVDAVDRFVAAIRAGHGVDTSAGYSGIPERTAKRWIARGRDAYAVAEDNNAPIPEEELPYVQFSQRVAEARAAAKVRNLTAIQTAATVSVVRDRRGDIVTDANGQPIMEATGDWKAAAWILERMYPDEFGPKTRTELTGAGGGPVAVNQRTEIDLQISMEHAAHPHRTALIADALADAGLILPPIIEGEVVDPADPVADFWEAIAPAPAPDPAGDFWDAIVERHRA